MVSILHCNDCNTLYKCILYIDNKHIKYRDTHFRRGVICSRIIYSNKMYSKTNMFELYE